MGATDSERAFCWLMQELSKSHAGVPSVQELTLTLRELTPRIARHGTFNFMLSNGQALWAHCSTNLFFVERKHPFAHAQLADEDLSIDFARNTTPQDKVAVVVTAPLTTNENWTAFAPGRAAGVRGRQRLDGQTPDRHASPQQLAGSLARQRASSASMNIAGTSKPACSVISWKQVGLVTLISVRQSPITSSPTSSRPRAASTGPIAARDLEVARGQRLRHALAAGGQVAADFAALRNARQAERHRLAADHQDALVALRDLGQEALDHDGGRAVVVQRLDDGAEVQAIGADPEDAHAAHAVQRLEDDLLVLGVEALHVLGVARDQRRADELRKLHDGELLGVVAQ